MKWFWLVLNSKASVQQQPSPSWAVRTLTKGITFDAQPWVSPAFRAASPNWHGKEGWSQCLRWGFQLLSLKTNPKTYHRKKGHLTLWIYKKFWKKNKPQSFLKLKHNSTNYSLAKPQPFLISFPFQQAHGIKPPNSLQGCCINKHSFMTRKEK